MNRAVRLDLQAPMPVREPRDQNHEPRVEMTREERFAESQKKILANYAETFRRLAE